MLNFAILAIPSIIVLIVMKYKYDHHISTKEVLIHAGAIIVMSLVVLGLTYAVLYAKLGDVEILNGEVTNKYKHTEWCTQSSSCKYYTWHERCSYSTDSKGKRTKSCVSYKVFDYTYEVDWYVESTVGSNVIERVNRQGTQMPSRWAAVKMGDPAAAEHYYTNYLFADEHSLFAERKFEESYDVEYQKEIPDYPSVYDYYNVSHIVNSTKHSVAGYEQYIANELKTLGKEKQLNLVIVLYNHNDPLYTDALLSKWRGGKKNDVIMMFGLDADGTVRSFRSTSFAQGMKNEMLHSTLRIDALSEKMNIHLLEKQVKTVAEKFNRLPNEDFKYMKYKMEPKKEFIVLGSIVLLVMSIFIGLYMRDNEL
ncbi:hypothetical protein EJP02_336 [Escherichia phage EJP2]|nr:hypothetical protein EJP02_336 [Escherichia phage EJP2]